MRARAGSEGVRAAPSPGGRTRGVRPSPRALWAGPGAWRALAAGGSGAVEIALHPGGYARLGVHWLLIAHARAPRGPLSLLVTGLEGAPLAVGDAVTVGHELRAGALRIDLSRLAPPLALVPPPLAPGWRAALRAAIAEVPPPAFTSVREEALAGRGEGLTPAGDDVLAGYAAWRHAEGRPVRFAGDRCSPLGLAYLRCAERGELPEAAARVLVAIRAGDVAAARRRARALSGWGASSGTAILWGMAAGARE